ncbi:MAG: hypothetical protein MHPDNHAH_02127 [Anaerolineales bacterium]|nr:hypothetical protein [Anaerolineales bacterium]
MITEIQLSTLVFFVAVIWGVSLILQGTPLSFDLLKPFTNVTGGLVLLLAFFDKWAWHWKIFHPWLVSTPYIEGTWKGKVKSNWINPETKQSIDDIDAFLVIRQKFSTIHARLISKESTSELLTGEIIKNADETWQFVGAYRNTPNISVRERSPIHNGAIILQIKGQTPIGLEGQYWTDRSTQGEITFSSHNKKKFFDFGSANAARYIKRQEK